MTEQRRVLTVGNVVMLVVILAFAVALLLPALARVRVDPFHETRNANNVRTILTVFHWKAIDDPRALTQERVLGDGSVRHRFAWLVSRDSDPVPPEMLVNPVAREPKDEPWEGDPEELRPDGSERLKGNNISYALIDHRSIAWQVTHFWCAA